MNSSELLRHALELARAGKKDAARDVFLRVVEEDPRNELAWMWLAGLVDSIEDQIVACENVLTINPSNEKARAYLDGLERRRNLKSVSGKIENKKTVPQPKKRDPLEEAKYLEQEGKFDKALMIYKVEAAKASDTVTFNELYKRIIYLEQNRVRGLASITEG